MISIICVRSFLRDLRRKLIVFFVELTLNTNAFLIEQKVSFKKFDNTEIITIVTLRFLNKIIKKKTVFKTAANLLHISSKLKEKNG